MRQSLGFFATLVAFVAMQAPASLADEQIGAFRIFDSYPNVVVLDGEIGINTPLEFRRALAARPDTAVVVLNSPGGLVASGLILANDIHDRGLATTIPEGAGCYSSCAFAFFAGAERLAEGELGVHQMYGTNDTSGVQARVSDIIEALEQFGTPTAVVTRMFRTPSEDMYVFSPGEIESLDINVLGPSVLADLSGIGVVSPAIDTQKAPATVASTPPEAEPDGGLRLALYGGLDFYGSDVSSQRTTDAVECASMCLYEDECLAFTFNANPSVTRGPNCFLKGGIERLEAYADAMSGVFLFPENGEAITYSIGAIDPTQDVLPRQGLSGRDFSTSPERGVASPGACRMACVDDNACRAFTYDARLKQCYLKHTVGTAFASSNLTSGVKRGVVFPPLEVIDLSD
jgi:hypothetical protein